MFIRAPAADHGWCVTGDGAIIDTTHRQFVRSRPIIIAAPGTLLARRYHPGRSITRQRIPASACTAN